MPLVPSNPISGAIQQDLRFTLNTDLMLPPRPNITGANFTVKFQNGSLQFNNSTGILNFLRGKKYRFLQINSGNSNPFEIKTDQTKIFEPATLRNAFAQAAHRSSGISEDQPRKCLD